MSQQLDKRIEFQFPSNGKVYPKLDGQSFYPGSDWEFQFPSNGKVYPKARIANAQLATLYVSIPFKRESVSKAGKRWRLIGWR